jgi:hypothetical protein
MDNEIKSHIDGLFTDFKAGITRFVDTQIKTYIETNAKSVINEAIKEALEASNIKLKNEIRAQGKYLIINNKKLNFHNKGLKSNIKTANKAVHELRDMFALIKNLNSKIIKFYERKRTTSTPSP